MVRVNAEGFTAAVTHPVTGRTLVLDILDDPQFSPSLNSLPSIRIPVRQSPAWLDSGLDDNPVLDVWRDGEKLPIDELVDVEASETQTVLVGEGGIELRDSVAIEYRLKERPQAANDLITNNTTYAADVDSQSAADLTDQTLDSADTTVEFNNRTSLPSDDPRNNDNGAHSAYQTCFVQESDSGLNNITRTDFSDGKGLNLANAGQDTTDNSFTLEYEIPDGEAYFDVRLEDNSTNAFHNTGTGSDFNTLRVDLDNNEVGRRTLGGESLGWFTIPLNGAVSPGSHTVRAVLEESGNVDSNVEVDVTAFYDDRFSYNFDNSVHTADGYLDGPEEFPDAVETNFQKTTTAFNIDTGTANLTIDDTTGSQRVQLSIDGTNFLPTDGTEDNTTSVTVDFSNLSTTLETRVRLSRHSPNGLRNQTPRTGYAMQSLDAYELVADLELVALLIDEQFEDSIANVLGEIAGAQFVWSYRLDNGTPTVAFTKPGQRTTDTVPEFSALTVEKAVETWEKVQVIGSNEPVTDETITASSTFQALVEDNLLTGSESVRDDATNERYLRKDDYEINYGAGEIRITSGGSITSGDTLRVDYSYQVRGSHTIGGASASPKTRVERIPGVVSDQQAEQLAYVIAEIEPAIDAPRYAASTTVERGGRRFDPLEALTDLSEYDVPDAATPLAPRGELQQTPTGLQLRLGGQRRLDAQIRALSRQVSRVSRRS